MLTKIISGGQTGVDIAALRAAKQLGIPTGGFMPKGYKTEAGPRPEYAAEFGMLQTNSADYKVRTKANVVAADGTLTISVDSPGYFATRRAAIEMPGNYPFLRIYPGDLFDETEREGLLREVVEWVAANEIRKLNVAGNRDVNLEEPVGKWLVDLFRALTGESTGAE